MITTSDDLIADIKLRGSIPTNSNRFTNARFLSLANSEMLMKIMPLVLAARQNYYEYDIDTTINSTGLYPVDTRAYLGILSNVALVDSDKRYDLPLLSEENEIDLDQPRSARAGFILKRNTIQLKPKDGVGYTSLRQTVLLRPGEFVLEASAAQITAISGTTLSFTADTIPTTWDTGDTFDLIQNVPQYDHLNLDLSASTVDSSGGTIELTSTPNSRLAVGDWIALSKQSPIIQCPETFAYYLSQRVANTCMRILGDDRGADAGERIAKEFEEELMKSIDPRTQKEAKKIVNRNGILRKNSWYRSY